MTSGQKAKRAKGVTSSSKKGTKLPQRRVKKVRFISKRSTANREVKKDTRLILERFRTATEAAQLGIWERDLENNILTWDDVMYKLYKIRKKDFKGTFEAWFSRIHPDDRNRIQTELKRATHGEKDYDTEFRIIWPDGTIRHIRAYGKVIKNSKGKPLKMIGINYDITKRKETEKALHESEELYRSLFEGSLEGIGLSKGNQVLDANKALLDIFGYRDLAEFKKIPLLDHVAPESRRIIEEKLARGYLRGTADKKFEYKIIRKDGALRDLEISAEQVRIGNNSFIQSTFRDITDRKKVEKALIENEERFRATFENANIGVCIVDTNGNILKVNEEMCKIFGYNREELEHMTVNSIAYPDDTHLSSQFMQKAIHEKNEQGSFDKRYIHKNGHIVWGHVSSSLVRDTNNMPLYFISHVQDITKRKEAEEALKESEEKFRTFAEQSPNMIFINKMGRIVYVNAKCEEIIGYSKEEFYSTDFDFLKITAPECVEMLKEYYKKHQKGEEVPAYEYVIFTKTGTRLDVIVTTKLIQYENGKAILGIITDITERKQTVMQLEYNLRETRVRYEISKTLAGTETEDEILDALIQHAGLYPQGFVVIYTFDDTEGELAVTIRRQDSFKSDLTPILPTGTRLSTSSYTLLGHISKEPFISNDINSDERIEPAGHEILVKTGVASLAIFPIMIENKRLCLIMVMTKFVGYFDREKLNLYKTLVEQGAVALQAARLRKQIYESQQRFQALVETINDWIWEVDQNGLFTYISPRIRNLLGYEPSELLGKTPFNLMQPEETVRIRSVLDQLFSSRQTIVDLKNTLLHKDGKLVVFETSATPFFDSNKEFKGYRGVNRDITERKRSENALRESEERFRRLVESVTDYIYSVKLEAGRPVATFHAPACVTVTGYASEEYAADPDLWYRMIYEEDRQSVQDCTTKALSGTEAPSFEHRIVHKNGSIRWVRNTPVLLRDDKGMLIAYDGLIADITELKEAEEERNRLQMELIQSQKMQSIGTLAGGVAHDFNNLLGIILGYTQLLESHRSDDKKFSDGIAAINRTIQRGASLVRQILTFARKADIAFELIHICDIIRELFSMLEQTFPKIISFAESCEKDLPCILADRTQIHQALLNLCVNARDAMPNGGTITIKAEQQSMEKVHERFPAADRHHYLCISVTDTGVGMDETTRTRAFDPFFTTKPVGKGTGMGLSVVYGIVHAHHGFVDLESIPAHGTTFRLYFPVPDTDEYTVDYKKPIEIYEIGGSETILLVEDEKLLIEMVQFMLESKGYKVYTAMDGLKAVEIYRQHKDEIALILTDMGLPELTGMDEFKKLQEINPDVKVAFASGFFEPGIKSELLKAGAKGFIQKPYESSGILRIIRLILDKK